MPWLAGMALLACYGCSAGNSSNGSGTGGEDAGASDGGGPDASNGSGGGAVQGSGGSSGSGSGGKSGSGGSAAGGSSGTGSGGAHGSGGSTSAGSGGTAAGTGGVTQPHCSLSMQPVSPSSFDDIEAGTIVHLQGFASEYPAMALHWSWTISGPPNTTPPSATKLNDAGSLMQFPVNAAGRYMITGGVSEDPNCQPITQSIVVTAPQGPTFNLRVTADGYPIQDLRVKLADGPSGSFQLDPGKAVTVKPLDPSTGAMRGSYVRISRPDKAFQIEGDTTLMPVMATLVSTQPYDVLIAAVDSTVSFAPFLISSSLPVNWSSQTFAIDPGTRVSGQMLTASGAPLHNARMQLRGLAPSTLGFSDSAGALTMLIRDGSMSAIIVPPDGSGLPVATTADGSIGAANGASLSLVMQWAALAQGTLTVQVRDPAGAPVPNSQVRLSSSGGAYAAGKLTVSSPNAADVMLTPGASVADSLWTDDSGNVTFPPYPAGTYAITIVPPAAAAPAAVTTVPVTMAAGATTQTVSLARKVSLTGTLSPTGAARVTAVDVGNACVGTDACPSTAPLVGTSAATGVVVSAQAADDGTFTLAVDPDRTYQVIVQPSGPSGRAILPSFRVCSTATAPCTKTNGGSLGKIPLPSGMPYQGNLSGRNGLVAGAFVQAFCVASSTSCADPTSSLAEATSLGDGSFSLTLPVP